MSTSVVDLARHNVILDAHGGGARTVEGGATFWTKLMRGGYPELALGRLLMIGEYDSDWTTWEMHPEGEELVILLSGRATFVLATNDGERTLELSHTGEMVLVPRGTWHTARTNEPVRMLFVTAGSGTQNRPA